MIQSHARNPLTAPEVSGAVKKRMKKAVRYTGKSFAIKHNLYLSLLLTSWETLGKLLYITFLSLISLICKHRSNVYPIRSLWDTIKGNNLCESSSFP